MKRLVLVDGNALLHRAYHATPPFTTSKGEEFERIVGQKNSAEDEIHRLHI